MAQTHNQELDTRINAMSTNITKNWTRIKQINPNITALNSIINSTIDEKMEALFEHVKNNLQSFATKMQEWMNPPQGPTSYEQPYNPKDIDFSHSMLFHSNPHRELCLPKVDMNKFDGSDPMD